MLIKLPKNSPQSLIKRVEKLKSKLDAGTAIIRKSERYGYPTLALGKYERAVLLQDTIHVFNNHRDYEKFINIHR
ncbi:hypothetical protein G6Z92_06315 [Vibrio aestuarianus subsp. cardii]|uniref:hypothetical protein n=1 Tax=Vibrio aestuarianus TaxID=28171 RepID=UPI0015C525F6|nr:hypothetical protein [Vibrio aestuarianus]NGZ66599.1 hypothetical protein [Vibrio aestuarianus subsp. cardii]